MLRNRTLLVRFGTVMLPLTSPKSPPPSRRPFRTTIPCSGESAA